MQVWGIFPAFILLSSRITRYLFIGGTKSDVLGNSTDTRQSWNASLDTIQIWNVNPLNREILQCAPRDVVESP